MNKLFYITNGHVEEQEPAAYYNIVQQQAQDALDELGGLDFDRKSASDYMDEYWRPNLTGDNLDTGGGEDYITVTDEQWSDYKNGLLDEVEKLVEDAKENLIWVAWNNTTTDALSLEKFTEICQLVDAEPEVIADFIDGGGDIHRQKGLK